MIKSKKLEIIYYNGQADGIKIIRRHLSTMTTYVIPRPLFAESKKIEDINNPGVYFLINEYNNNNIAQIYIGQARNGIERLNDHNRKKRTQPFVDLTTILTTLENLFVNLSTGQSSLFISTKELRFVCTDNGMRNTHTNIKPIKHIIPNKNFLTFNFIV